MNDEKVRSTNEAEIDEESIEGNLGMKIERKNILKAK